MLHLFALGEPRLETDAGVLLSRRRKPLVLLTFLARRAPRPASRVELAALLWGERPDAKARQSLRQALLELHRLVGERLQVAGESVRLDTTDLALDVVQFEDDVQAGRDLAAIDRWAGDFCAGGDEDSGSAFSAWADAERAGLRRRLTLAFERLLDDAARRGDSRESLAIARRWAAIAPLDEHACLRLITALRRDGRAVDALAVHTSFVARLHEELDAVPSRTFLQLAQSLDDSARTPPARPAMEPPGRARHAESSTLPFVGRGAPFLALSSAWSTARGGRPAIVIVNAAPGMGASRLCDELVRWTRDAAPNTVVLRDGTARRRMQEAPYSAAQSLFAPLCEAPALGGVAPAMLSALASVVPGIRSRFHDLPSFPDDSEGRKAAALREAIDVVAEDAPVLVVADRLDAMDPASRALLVNVARELSGGVLVVLVADLPADELRALERLLEVARDVEIVELQPFSIGQITELLQSFPSLQRDDAVSLAGELIRETDGVPALVIPLVQALVDEGTLAGNPKSPAHALADLAALPIPEPINRHLQDRRGALTPDARRLLDGAAVFGRPIDRAAAAALAGLEPIAASQAIEQLLDAHLLTATGGDRYALSPPIVARAAYALVPALRREALHAVAATLVKPSGFLRGARDARARLAYHQRAAGLPARRRTRVSPRVVVATILTAAALVGGVTVSRRTARATGRDPSVAIFPFAVSGDPKLRFLEAGMVDLLSTSLDGAAGLRTIDPRAVIAATQSSRGTHSVSVDEARAMASSLGARYFVLGTVVGAGGRLEISASMYETGGTDSAATRASASGSSDGLFDIVDRVTAQLAVARGSPAGERLARLAAVTTPSLDALKAYLEARSAYRSNDLYAAIPAYQRAVAADSTFALAWYGLASAASWMLRPTLERHAAEQAVRFSERLSARDRTLLAGFAAYSRGAADSAERMATSIAETYDDIEGWVLLGEVLYHHNWKRGRSAVESRRAWERVLALDPHYWPALEHLAEVAALEGNARQADSLLLRYQQSVGAEHMMVASRALRAYAYEDAPSRAAVEPQLTADRGFWLILSVWYVSVFGRDLDDAQRLAHLLVDPLRPPGEQELGRVLLAHLALARGHWREARAELAIARAHDPADAIEQLLLLSLAPPLATTPADVAARRAELMQLPPAQTAETSTIPWPQTPRGLQPIIRAYLAGMASARIRDEAGRERALAQLAALPDPTSTSAMAQGFVFSIRAEHERALGRPAAALALLEQGARSTPFVAAWTSGIVSQAYERFVRAELLHELGRDDDALRWYGTFGENSPYDLVYLAPSLFRAAQIYDARGDRTLASRDYARFLTLWKDCDAELRPMTAIAEARLAALR